MSRLVGHALRDPVRLHSASAARALPVEAHGDEYR
jgi:hypothetical protein